MQREKRGASESRQQQAPLPGDDPYRAETRFSASLLSVLENNAVPLVQELGVPVPGSPALFDGVMAPYHGLYQFSFTALVNTRCHLSIRIHSRSSQPERKIALTVADNQATISLDGVTMSNAGIVMLYEEDHVLLFVDKVDGDDKECKIVQEYSNFQINMLYNIPDAGPGDGTYINVSLWLNSDRSGRQLPPSMSQWK
jgi:hypothetical protein